MTQAQSEKLKSNALENALKAIEDLGRKRCTERGESWDEMQARLHANRVAAGNHDIDRTVTSIERASAAIYPASNVSEEEWADRRADYRGDDFGKIRHPDYSHEHSTYQVINGRVS